MPTNTPSDFTSYPNADVGSGVFGDPKPATLNQQPLPVTTYPKDLVADLDVNPTKRETPVGGADLWFTQEMVVLRA
jgi:hypothetical protein